MGKYTFGLVVQLSFLGLIWGYGTLVPVTEVANLCTNMRPYHSEVYDSSQSNSNIAPYLNAQTGTPLYEIIVNQTCYKPGDTLKVTLRGKIVRTTYTPFLGTFLMARKHSNPTGAENFGTFTIPDGEINLRTYDCFSRANSAIGHNNRNTKRNNYVLWTPSGVTSDVVFVATFVEERTVFWTNVRSSTIEYDKDCNSGVKGLNVSFIVLATIAMFTLFTNSS